MSMTWGARWTSFLRNGRNLQIGWIVSMAIVGVYLVVIRPQQQKMSINDSKATGLAAFTARSEPLEFRSQTKLAAGGLSAPRRIPTKVQMAAATFLDASPQAPSNSEDAETDRKMVRTATLEMLVQQPSETAEKIRTLAEREGGFIVSSEVRSETDTTGATLTIRVPAARFEAVRDQVRKLGIRVEDERIEAQDVTRQYTDQEANLRNLKAEEQQYLLILKQARTVKDTLEVSEKLSDVRGMIEQQQAEFNSLSKQIETVAITITLRAEAEARVLGLNWRPLYQVKVAFRDGLDGLATYFSEMTAFLFFLPTLVLWIATVGLAGAAVWRILRWVGRRWLGWKTIPHATEATPAN